MRNVAAALVFVVALGAGSSARADGTEADRVKAAADEFDAGRRAFKNKEYATAAEHFENANRDAPTLEALRSAMRARREAKQDARAATLAALALARYPDDKAMALLAQQVLATAEKSLHRLTVRCAPACTLLVDRKLSPWGEGTTAVLWLDPGDHAVVAGWGSKREVKADVAASAGTSADLSMKEPPPPPAADAPPVPRADPSSEQEPSHTGLPKGVFLGAVAVSVVLTGVAVWSAIDMRANPGKDKVHADCAGRDTSCPTYQDALSVQRRTNVLGAAAAVAMVGTAALGVFFTQWSPSASPGAGATIAPTLSIGGGVMVGGAARF